MLSKIKNILFGAPCFYDRLRPLLLGGFDFSVLFSALNVGPDDVIIDIGCGTGAAMPFLTEFKEYHGFDTDKRAIDTFGKRYQDKRIHLYNREVEPHDLKNIVPSRVVMVGLMHHLPPENLQVLLKSIVNCSHSLRIATLDPVYVKGKPINNLLVRLDRGKYASGKYKYSDQVTVAGMKIAETFSLCSGKRLAHYFVMILTLLQENGS